MSWTEIVQRPNLSWTALRYSSSSSLLSPSPRAVADFQGQGKPLLVPRGACRKKVKAPVQKGMSKPFSHAQSTICRSKIFGCCGSAAAETDGWAAALCDLRHIRPHDNNLVLKIDRNLSW
jgi:hypothetical protein